MRIKLLSSLSLIVILLSNCDREISTTQPDPEPGTGKISVVSNPPGYDIYLENRISGYQTPHTFSYLDRGRYNFSLKSPYMLDTVGSIFLQNNTAVDTLFIDLVNDYRFYGAIDFESTPSGAEIFVNEESTGFYTPKKVWNIYPGTVSVSLRKRGYRNSEKDILLRSMEEYDLKVIMEDTTIWLVSRTDNSNIPSNKISCIGDQTTFPFIGSSDMGVILADEPRYSYYNGSNSGLNAYHINSLTRFGQKGDYLLFAATNNGLYVKDAYTQQWWDIQNDFTDFNERIVNDIAAMNNYDFYTNEPDRLFVCTENNGLCVFESDAYYSYNSGNSVIPSSLDCISIYGKQVCIGSKNNGVYFRDWNEDEWQNYNTINSILDSDNIVAIALTTERGSNGVRFPVFYAATNTGNVYRKDETGLTHFFGPVISITSMAISATKDLWIGTTYGIAKKNKYGLTKYYSTMNTSLPSNSINDLVDYYNQLWVATYKGLAIYKYQNDTGEMEN